ncbi:DNA-deoxyinosine glycosylase [Anaeromicropila herbilytica]|uniref:DNA-deoxyinosine glycosylase n=1 Tax=Anaeromicropila herbilytica TaxID=2785025 RepID=A0A7R7ENG4_9FIRM|nr:DNA-deoxyinosine glycosylase [Anaeromicropila herbilytica]BCN32038.1 DNA-deoxyinosine glycosylase [Anaeromicropila herbilytica]
MEQVTHTFLPIYSENSKILILGTFPSVKSREGNFYYNHPQNRFWKVLASITNEAIPTTIDEKKDMLLRNNIAIWDVIKSCEIEGSSDSSIKNVIPNDLSIILEHNNIKNVYGNGDKAYQLYMKYCYKNIERDMIKLPSTSPANASYTLERLIDKWEVIKKDLK